MSLEKAAEHIKLAVDLIQLLEENELEPDTVLRALALVKDDFQRKQNKRYAKPKQSS